MSGSLVDRPLERRLQKLLQDRKEQGLLRILVKAQPGDQGYLDVGGRKLLNLASNDYLGLGGNRQLLADFYAGLAAEDRLVRYGLSSGGSRLMTGNHGQYSRLEAGLAKLYGAEKVLVFNSGYHINIGLLPALAGKEDLILADKLCHASLIDGMRLSRARVIRYPHRDYDRVEELLTKHHDRYRSVFLVSESIFSMDGDCADLSLLVRLKEQYGAILYLDEAHGVGVRGQYGLGLAEEQGVADSVDLLVGTFGKAWGGQGAFAACSETVYDYLVNTARSLIYTTALPPVNLYWLNFILPRFRAMTGERQHLHALAKQLRSGLKEKGLRTDGDSQIVPVIIGDSGLTVALADKLRGQGYWVNAIRPPTVPQGTARLRLSLTAAMESRQLAPLPGHIATALAELTS